MLSFDISIRRNAASQYLIATDFFRLFIYVYLSCNLANYLSISNFTPGLVSHFLFCLILDIYLYYLFLSEKKV